MSESLEDVVDILEDVVDIHAALKNVGDASKIPRGFPEFLSAVHDQAKKLAVPVIITSVSVAAAALSGGAAIPVCGAISTTVGLGKAMMGIYQSSENSAEEQQKRQECYLDEKLKKFENLQRQIICDVGKLTLLTGSEQQHIEEKLEKLGSNIMSKIDNAVKTLKGRDDESIKIAYCAVEKKLQKKQFNSAKNFLLNMNLDEMYVNSNTNPQMAEELILQALNEQGKEAAVDEYQRLLIIRQKLEVMKQLKCFFQDQYTSNMINMEGYCNSEGKEYLQDLEEYWGIMKNKAFKNDDSWKIPKILILGKTGTGKSTLCNVLAGKLAESDKNSGGFPVSSETDSCTKDTTCGDFCYLGNSSRPITIIDTPGFDDPSKNQDAQIISNLVEELLNMKEVHQILIAVNGTNPRLDGSMKAMIDIFQRMFTPKIWGNIGIVFTKLSMDKASVKKREKHSQKSDRQFAGDYVRDLRKEFHFEGTRELETYFIDACYDDEDPKETESFEKGIESLWRSISTKEKFDTNHVEKVLTEFDSMKKMLEQKELDLKDQERKIDDLEAKEFLRLEKDKEEARIPEYGYTYYQVKSTRKYKSKIDDYFEYISTTSPKLHHFEGDDKFDEQFWSRVKSNWETNTNEGFTKRVVPTGEVFDSITEPPIIFVLRIHNTTKYFLNGVDFSGTDKPAFLWHPDKTHLTELKNFNSFVLPPFTTERVIFIKNAYFKSVLKSVLTFSLGNFPPTTSVQKAMIMFKIAGSGKNSYAVGFPKQTISNKEIQQILKTRKEKNEYYSKAFTSKQAEKDNHNDVSKIFWPPEDEQIPGGFEITFSCGNRRQCIGFVTLKKISEKIIFETKL